MSVGPIMLIHCTDINKIGMTECVNWLGLILTTYVSFVSTCTGYCTLVVVSQMIIHFVCYNKYSVYKQRAARLGSQVNATIKVLHNKLLTKCKVDVCGLDKWGCFH